MLKYLPPLVIFATMLTTHGSRPDDTSDGVPLPGWRAEPAGSALVTAGDVALASDRVTIMLRFSAKRSTTSLVAVGPRFGWIGMGEYYPARHFPELAIELDGSAVEPGNEIQAIAGAVDIAPLLRSANIDGTIVARNEAPILSSSTPAEVVDGLKQAGALSFLDPGWLTEWRINRIVRLGVSGAGQHGLTFTYGSRPSFQYLPSPDTSSPLNTFLYCSTMPELLDALGSPADPAVFRIHEYALPVGVDGLAPPTVTLSVGAPGTLERTRVLLVVCKPDGSALIERGEIKMTPVQVGADGVLHVLSISNPLQ